MQKTPEEKLYEKLDSDDMVVILMSKVKILLSGLAIGFVWGFSCGGVK